jgi:hypothetical protein
MTLLSPPVVVFAKTKEREKEGLLYESLIERREREIGVGGGIPHYIAYHLEETFLNRTDLLLSSSLQANSFHLAQFNAIINISLPQSVQNSNVCFLNQLNLLL